MVILHDAICALLFVMKNLNQNLLVGRIPEDQALLLYRVDNGSGCTYKVLYNPTMETFGT